MNLHRAPVNTAQVMESGRDRECSTCIYGSYATICPPPHRSQHADPLHEAHALASLPGKVRKKPERPEPLHGWRTPGPPHFLQAS